MRCFAGVFTVEAGGEESENGALRVDFCKAAVFSGVFPIYRNEMGRVG